jgi:hypothetical protein
MIGETMFQVDSIPVEVKDCDHCKQRPSDDEVRAAVRKSMEMRSQPRFRCGHCGEAIRVTSYRMYHSAEGWAAAEQEVEQSISIDIQLRDGPTIFAQNGLHLRCVAKALPYANGLLRGRA